MLTFMWQNDTGIYFMHNGVCVAEDSFLQARELGVLSNSGLQQNGLHCFLASGVTIAQVKWLYPNGNHVICSDSVDIQNDIGCVSPTINNGSILYTSNFGIDWPWLPEYNGLYTCCLLGNVLDGSSNSITVRIFS